MAIQPTSQFRNEFQPQKEKGLHMCLPCFGKKIKPQDTQLVKTTPLTPEMLERARKMR